jgi:hypothetical protein
MKKIFVLIAFLISSSLIAQYREDSSKQPDIKGSIVKTNSFGSILGFINPDNFSMKHSFNLSFTSFGGLGSMALGVYTNSMEYKFSDNLDLQTDISFINSPYSSFGKDFSKQFNGIYLSRLQMNYKASDNMNISIQYRQIPGGFYSPYSYWDNSFYRGSYFSNWGF